MRGSGQNSKPLTESDRIKQLIIRVGDDGPNFYKRDIDKLSLNLETYYQKTDQSSKDQVLEIFAECVTSLPHKASIYATVISLISIQNASIPEVLLDKVLAKLQNSLEKGDVQVPRAALIFLGELMNIGLFNRFIFINVLFDLFHEADRSFDSSQDYYLHIGISAIPYVMDHLKEKNKLELNSLVQSIDKLMQRRNKNYLKVLKIRKDQPVLKSRLDTLWGALQEHIESGKKTDLSIINRPYEQYHTELAGLKELKRNIKIQFGSKAVKSYQSPPYYLLFDENLVKKEASSTIDLAILGEKIADVLTMFNTSKKLAAQLLLQINETHHCPHLIIQNVFAGMFQLPNPLSRPLFYSSLLITLVNDIDQSKKEELKKLIHQMATTIFTQCANFDVEILDRFMSWLPHFLSNFNFEWDWSEWKFVCDLDSTAPECVLLRGIFRKLAQISFHDRLKEVIPDELKPYLPSEEITSFEYNSEAPNHSDAEIIKDKLNSKPTGPEMTDFIKSGENNLEASGELLLDIFVQCLLTRCSVTLTHFNANMEKYHSTISQLLGKEEDQLVILDAVRKFYNNSNFHTLLTIDGMENFKILDKKNIIVWIFDSISKEDDIQNHFQLYWDLLFALIEKNATIIQTLQDEINGVETTREKNPNVAKDYSNAIAEQQALFAVIFKKMHHLVGEVFTDNQDVNHRLINRLIQIARKYKKEISETFTKVEEDFSKLPQPEIQEAFKQLEELKV